jgi:hypothetical protein
MTIAICTPSSRAKNELQVRYEIEDRITVTVPKTPVSMWVPVIPETPYQRIIDVSIVGPARYALTPEGEFGNQMLQAVLARAGGDNQELNISYGVERLPVMHMLDPSCARTLATSCKAACGQDSC